MGFENVGRVWTPSELRQYLQTIQRPAWCRAITLHHTGVPSLAQRPRGFLPSHITATQHYYQRTNGWSAGPHLFIDDDQCWGMTDFRQHGVHARSFNRMAIGIEVLGNYNEEAPNVGRGANCWNIAAAASRALLDWLGLEANQQTVLFHRDDPRTTKTCPGSKVQKNWVIDLIKASSNAGVGVGAIGAAAAGLGAGAALGVHGR